jgi:hypothetical protein
MNSTIKDLANQNLLNAFFELSKNDIVLQQVLKKTDTPEEFINALLAAIICLTERENQFQQTIIEIMKSNPEIKKILELKNDKSLLYKNET